MTTPNAQIPEVPEGTLDPAAGLNLSLRHVDALLQTAVIRMDLTTPPVTSSDGDLYIVASPGAGEWAGQSGNLARFVLEGTFWQFFPAGDVVKIVLNRADGLLYVAEVLASPVTWSPLTGVSFLTEDSPAQVVQATGLIIGDGLALDDLTGGVARLRALGSGDRVVNTAASSLAALAGNAGHYTRFSHAAPSYVFDAGAGYSVGQEFLGRYTGVGSLTLTPAGGMTLNAPASTLLTVSPGQTFRVKIVASNEADVATW